MHMAYHSATLNIIMEYPFAQCYNTISACHFRNTTIVGLQESFQVFPILPLVVCE